MKTAELTGVVRRFGRRVVSPALPRVRTGFRTIYRSCHPQAMAEALPTITWRPRFPRFPRLPQLPPLPRLPRIPRIEWSKYPAAMMRFVAAWRDRASDRVRGQVTHLVNRAATLTQRLPRIQWTTPPGLVTAPPRSASTSSRRRMQLTLIEWMELAAFCSGYGLAYCFERLRSLRSSGDEKLKMLVALDAPLAEAMLFEPVLRSMREHYRDRVLHLWAGREVCELYRAAPYIGQLHEIEERHDPQRITRGRRIGSHWRLGLALGRDRFSLAIIDMLGSRIARECMVRSVRTDAVCVLDHQGNAREQIQPSGRLLRHMPFSSKCDPVEALSLLAEQWRGRIVGDFPRVYAGDTAAQLAYSRARSWRSQAAVLGATSIVGVAPCAHPPDSAMTIGIGLWAQTARELWVRHRALAVILAEGSDPDAVDQLSSLLGEVPHAKLTDDMDVLERAGLIARLDLLIGSAGWAAQLALAQKIPAVVIGCAARRRLYTWSRDRGIYLHPDSTGRLDTAEVMRAYRRLTMKPMPQRVAV